MEGEREEGMGKGRMGREGEMEEKTGNEGGGGRGRRDGGEGGANGEGVALTSLQVDCLAARQLDGVLCGSA